jgi:hypothetical protein
MTAGDALRPGRLIWGDVAFDGNYFKVGYI